MALACFMQFRLIRLKKDVRWLSIPGGASLIDQLVLLEKKDALIASGFVNIPRETQTAIQRQENRLFGFRYYGFANVVHHGSGSETSSNGE